MSIFGKSEGHFLADITVYACGPESDRRNNPAFNGIRWGFSYAEDYEESASNPLLSDVWPEFLDLTGVPITADVPLIGSYTARMHIVFSDMIERHFKRLRIGTKFYCTEGSMITAEGVVTKLSI